MAAWVATDSVVALRNSFNKRFPNRDRASDGTIGDQAHQAGTSGHNPDEEGHSELVDADKKNEVRALDIDKDLRDARGYTLDSAIRAIMDTPADLARIQYIIWKRRICSRNNGWRWVAYSGPNPHDQHAHFSFTVASDEDTRPFLSVERLGLPAPVVPEEDDLKGYQLVGELRPGLAADADGNLTDRGNATLLAFDSVQAGADPMRCWLAFLCDDTYPVSLRVYGTKGGTTVVKLGPIVVGGADKRRVQIALLSGVDGLLVARMDASDTDSPDLTGDEVVAWSLRFVAAE